MRSRTALTILTYVDRERPAAVRRRLPAAIASLERTGYRGPVAIVDDGSTCDRHQTYLDRLAKSRRYDIVRRAANGGISRAKNTCLRAIAEYNVHVGFLAEDDILFHDGWQRAYQQAMQRCRVQHFSWFVPHRQNRIVACNSGLVTATAGLLGLLLTLTRDVLSTVGGFKVLPHRYGYEHIQWTYRNMLAGFCPFPCDIVESRRFIERNTTPSSVPRAEVRAGAAKNMHPGHVIDALFEPLDE